MRTLIFAHRGYSKKYPENTLPAFKGAVSCGADGIELDVQLSKDGVPVIIHDETLQRMTRHHGFVKDYTVQELQALKIVKRYGFRVVRTYIPTLEEVLRVLQPTNIILNIELKNTFFPYEGMEEKVLQLVNHFHMENRTIYSSFNQSSVARITSLDKTADTALLYSKSIPQPWVLAKALHAKSIHPNFRAVTKDLIEKSHNHRLKVRAYTVNQPIWIRRLSEWKIDGIVTNNPVLALRSLK